MFQDEIRLTVRGGKGGDGMVCFFREKYRPKGGPAGGDGGDGGDVVLVASHDVHGFHGLRGRKKLKAEGGEPGGVAQRGGKDGEDLVVKVPVGTEIRDADTGVLLKDLAETGDEVRIVEGVEVILQVRAPAETRERVVGHCAKLLRFRDERDDRGTVRRSGGVRC